MNLIEQLKQTPKLIEFEKWWISLYKEKLIADWFDIDNKVTNIYVTFYCWCDLPFEMQESVFKKFITINSKSVISFTESYWNLYLTEEDDFVWNQDFNTFEELIVWYFNN